MKEDLIKLLLIRGENADSLEKHIIDLASKYESYAEPLKERVFFADKDYIQAAEVVNDRKFIEAALLSLLLTSINPDNSFDKPAVRSTIQRVCDSLGIKYEDVLIALRHERKVRELLDFAS